MSVIDDYSALLKIFGLELHLNIEAKKKQEFCLNLKTKLDEHSLKSEKWFVFEKKKLFKRGCMKGYDILPAM